MRVLFLFISMMIITLMMRPKCQQESVHSDCRIVCADAGYDYDAVKQTGFFTYSCQCKRWPAPTVEVPRRR